MSVFRQQSRQICRNTKAVRTFPSSYIHENGMRGPSELPETTWTISLSV